mgnify:CR=1 FL=1
MVMDEDGRRLPGQEPLLVLLVEMFIFGLMGLGILVFFDDLSQQPGMQCVGVLVLLVCSVLHASALCVCVYLPDLAWFAFHLTRAAWHWGLAATINFVVVVTAIFTAERLERDNWIRVLLQKNIHTAVSLPTVSAQVAVVLAVCFLVTLLQTVFYTKLKQMLSAEAKSDNFGNIGRFSVMLAVASLFSQFWCQQALARICDFSMLEPCDVGSVKQQLKADYTSIFPVSLVFVFLMAIDLISVFARQKLRTRFTITRILLYAVLRVVPIVAFVLASVLVVDHTLVVLHVYNCVVGGLLLGSVVYSTARVCMMSMSRRGETEENEKETARGGDDTHFDTAVVAQTRKAIGTAQTTKYSAKNKKL